MITSADKLKTKTIEQMRGGEGSAQLQLFAEQDLPKNVRLMGMITLEAGCSIGEHTHEKEAEVFFVAQGNPTGIDGAKRVALSPGDIFVTYSGHSHSLINETDEVCSVFAAIITE